MWEEFGDLPSAERDITWVLDKFGPNTFVLFLRADIRAQRENYPGVRHWAKGRAREAAIRITPGPRNSRRMSEAN